MTYVLRKSQFLPINISEAWSFFSSPKNLALITPPELSFKVLTNIKDEEIFEGMEIDYIVKPLLGIPLKWKTKIGTIEQGRLFIDRQVKGPYKLWEHIHTFVPQDGGVMMHDEVNYKLPFGIFGDLAHFLFVRKKIEYIFDYRKNMLSKLFNR